MDRRDFVKKSGLGLFGLVGLAFGLKPKREFKTEEWLKVEGQPETPTESPDNFSILPNCEDNYNLGGTVPWEIKPDFEEQQPTIFAPQDDTDMKMQWNGKELSLKRMALRLKEIEQRLK